MKTAVAVLISSVLGLVQLSPAMALENTEDHPLSKLLKKQVTHSSSVGSAVSALLSNYPEKVQPIVSVAFDTYPQDYKEIITASLRENSVLCSDVVAIALKKEVGPTNEILELALHAEPAYADAIVEAAIHHSKKDTIEIVRFAITVEPTMADSIIKSAANSSELSFVEILADTFSSIPFLTDYLLEALIAIYPDQTDDIIRIALENNSAGEKELEGIIYAARNTGMNDERINEVASTTLVDKDSLAKVMDKDGSY